MDKLWGIYWSIRRKLCYKDLIRFLIFVFLFHFQAVTNEDVTQEELGGAKTHTSLSGKCWKVVMSMA